MKAEEFISHEEIINTLEYAIENKNNTNLINNILEKAAKRQGLSHQEAAVLLECEDKSVTDLLVGDFVNVIITDALEYDLMGVIEDEFTE